MLFICNSSAICPLNIRLTVVESQKYAYEFRKNHSQLRKICVNLNRQKYYPQFNRNHVLTNRIQCVLVEHCFVGDKTRTSISVEEISIFKKHNSNRIFLIQHIEIYYLLVSKVLYDCMFMFCKILKKYSPNAHCLRLVSVSVASLFDMHI